MDTEDLRFSLTATGGVADGRDDDRSFNVKTVKKKLWKKREAVVLRSSRNKASGIRLQLLERKAAQIERR